MWRKIFLLLSKTVFFVWFFAHLFVPLTSSKVLSLDNKNKSAFILYCPRLFVPLHYHFGLIVQWIEQVSPKD